jgi:hypothetical protein
VQLWVWLASHDWQQQQQGRRRYDGTAVQHTAGSLLCRVHVCTAFKPSTQRPHLLTPGMQHTTTRLHVAVWLYLIAQVVVYCATSVLRNKLHCHVLHCLLQGGGGLASLLGPERMAALLPKLYRLTHDPSPKVCGLHTRTSLCDAST